MSYLDDLLASTAARVSEAKEHVTPEVLEQRVAAQEGPRGFAAALGGEGVTLIAEIKRASPSKGVLDADLNAAALAHAYAAGGAAALSVVTEPDHFGGSLDDLEAARVAGLPVLRKDFVIDAWQLLEARAAGADAVLLIVRVIGDELSALLSVARSLRMDELVEVHDADDLARALEAGARLVGVNHRDLATFTLDAGRTAKLAPLVPDGIPLVALSGVSRRADVTALAAAGAHAVLVGEALVTSPDPAAKLRALLGERAAR
ncbi:indole-3-glycerol phosphate synthase TrpC [soil metagenome]